MFNKNNLKTILVFAAVVFVVWVVLDGLPRYQNWQKLRDIKKQAEEFERGLKEREALIAADTYGGKTPQETLGMFIKAVEAGDYELASKYFVVEKQGEELKSLQNAPKENIQNVMKLLKGVNEQLSIKEPLWKSRNHYVITTPILVEYIRYPSGIWKINEI